jgi:hypothetical protein
MTAKLVTLYEHNYRDPVASLRSLADEIENGVYGDVGCIGIVISSDKLTVFGMGPDSEGPSVGMVLHAGFMKLCRMLDE